MDVSAVRKHMVMALLVGIVSLGAAMFLGVVHSLMWAGIGGVSHRSLLPAHSDIASVVCSC